MKRDEVLERLNLRFAGTKCGTINSRHLEEWVAEGLALGPTPKGVRRGQPVNWIWSADAYKNAVRVCRLRTRGIRRHAMLRFMLWLEQRAELNSFEALRGDVCAEFHRVIHLLTREVSSTFDPRSDRVLSPYSASALTRQLGELDSAFRHLTGDLPPTVWAALYGLLRFAFTDAQTIKEITQSVSTIVFRAEVPEALHDFTAWKDVLAGFDGDSSEIEEAVETRLASATLSDFRAARLYLGSSRTRPTSLSRVVG